MKSLSACAALVLSLGLSACGVSRTPVPQTPAEDLPRSLQPIPVQTFTPPPGAFVTINPDVPLGEGAVWRAEPALEPCRGPVGSSPARPVPADCLAEALREAGAPGPAVQASRWLSADGDPGWLTGWRREGPLAVAEVTRPFRANTNTEIALVPTSGAAIFPDDAPVVGFENDPVWSGFRAKHPNAFPVGPSALIASERHLTGWRLVYGAPLRDCRACDDLGRLMTAYDFDSRGVFTGRSLLSAQ